ncbi:MAG: phenylalanine--tRNA ligase subunit alpha [Anaerolineae bacterium]|nr:phenylalanine--tRNA ligase subunit alpha [Anaerolineae bacterium]
MNENGQALQARALAQLDSIWDPAKLEEWRVEFIGRKGAVNALFEQINSISKEERGAFGKQANEVKQALETAFTARQGAVKQRALSEALEAEPLDVTLPGRRPQRGRLHPTTQTLREMYKIFGEMGFQVYRTRQVETDLMNFQLLNIPPYHPARDNWSTFYVADTDERVVLRTHTSPGQVRVMREMYPGPIRAILPGLCYRYEQISSRYEIQFNQLEGLAVGHNITFGDLKGTLTEFARRMFGERPVRFFADHFPFTEPSAQMDVKCIICEGAGCALCKYTGWLEILGGGMVHPVVLRNGGYDPDEWSGFAFGMGPERITMLKHGITDIRYFWGNDLRFLEQF